MFFCSFLHSSFFFGSPSTHFSIDAAQASRDRKKEHTHHLELRVAELEAQLCQSGSTSHVLSFPSFPFTPRSNRFHPTIPPSHSRRQSQRQRSHSVTSSVEDTNSAEVDVLEDENDSLRHALYDEQEESARLRERLDSLESNFIRMESYFQANTGPKVPTFEPTFSFDNHTSSPKNESLSPLLSNDATLLPLTKPIITDDSIMYTTIKEEEVESSLGKESEQSKSHIINLRLVAREVDLSLQRKLMINSNLFLPLSLLPFLLLLLLPILPLSSVLLHLLPPSSPWIFSGFWVPVLSPSLHQKAKDPLYPLLHPLPKSLTCQKKLIHLSNSLTRVLKMRRWKVFGRSGLEKSLSLRLRKRRWKGWIGGRPLRL